MDGALAPELHRGNEAPKEPTRGTVVEFSVYDPKRGQTNHWHGMIYDYVVRDNEKLAQIMLATLPARFTDIPVDQVKECNLRKQDAILSMLSERMGSDGYKPEIRDYLERLILEQQVKIASKKR